VNARGGIDILVVYIVNILNLIILERLEHNELFIKISIHDGGDVFPNIYK
jgi:hypothetical protein